MTSEEFERLKDSIRVKDSHKDSVVANGADAKTNEERRKLDRDMDRIERVLKRIVDAPRGHRQMGEDDRRWEEFERASRERFDKIKEIAARSDEKLKALREEIRNKQNNRTS
jgi:hypothetical protein